MRKRSAIIRFFSVAIGKRRKRGKTYGRKGRNSGGMEPRFSEKTNGKIGKKGGSPSRELQLKEIARKERRRKKKKSKISKGRGKGTALEAAKVVRR